MWGGWHYCTLPAPFDETLRLAVRCSHKEFVPPAQALQSLPQPLQHHDTERALVWLLLDPAAAGDGSPVGLGMSTPTPKLGLLTPKGFPGKIAQLLHHPLSFSPPMAFGDNVHFLLALPAFQALHFFPASSCLTEFL